MGTDLERRQGRSIPHCAASSMRAWPAGFRYRTEPALSLLRGVHARADLYLGQRRRSGGMTGYIRVVGNRPERRADVPAIWNRWRPCIAVTVPPAASMTLTSAWRTAPGCMTTGWAARTITPLTGR